MRALNAVESPVRQASTRWSLAARVGEALRLAGVRHSAWKADPKVARFEAGAGDLDLLVDRRQRAELLQAISPLGFRAATAPTRALMPGVESFLAPHPETGALLHVHAHTQLLIGRSGRTQYHLPLERALLASATWRNGLRVPTPTFAFVIAVLHQVMRIPLRDVLRDRDPAWVGDTQETLGELERLIEPGEVDNLLVAHLPAITPDLFARCVAALRPGASPHARLATMLALRSALRAHRRRAGIDAIGLRLRRRVESLVGRWWGRSEGLARPASGGFVVALVGGDGAGKSTCATALVEWLGHVFDVRHTHAGRPPRGPMTLGAGALLKLSGRLRRMTNARAVVALDDHLMLLRVYCTARDRSRAHAIAHRHAARGGITICERHPSAEHEALAGSSEQQGAALAATSRLATSLRRRERACYAGLARPDLTLVLRLEPELAVSRKPEEPADYVRRRATLVFARAWDRADERVVDASRPLPDVLRELRSRVWELV
jgi:thymidylate kinase